MYIYLIFSFQVCTNEHINHRWCSQPLLNMRMHAGDLMLASSILISGNNFQKISTLAKCLKLPFLSSSTFHRIQGNTLCPQLTGFGCNNRRMFSVNFRTKILLCWVRPHEINFYILVLSVKIWEGREAFIIYN